MGKEEDIKRKNEEVAMRFIKIGGCVSDTKTIAGLFETLFAGIEKEFAVPFVWLTLIDSEKSAPVIDAVKSSDILKSRLCVVSRELFEKLLPGGLKPVLVNKDLQPFFRLMPPNRKYFVKSLAVVPFTLDDQIIGAWHNGDATAKRYEADMDTSLLQSLAGKLSGRLNQLISAK